VAPKAGKGVILILALPGQWAIARKKSQNLCRGGLIATNIAVSIFEEAA
jgi:hypothetical protein